MFHVSQLKLVLGTNHSVSSLPEAKEYILQPEDIINSRYDEEGYLEALIQGRGLPVHDRSWIRVKDLCKEFSQFEFVDKLNVIRGRG